MRWKLRLSEYDYEVLNYLRLVHHVRTTLSRLFYASDTKVSKLIDDKVSKFEASPAALKQRLK